MRESITATRSGSFRTYYCFSLLAWTVASLGLLGQVRSGLRIGGNLLILSAIALAIMGWLLPLLQNRHSESVWISRCILIFPFLTSALLGFALLFAMLFAAA